MFQFYVMIIAILYFLLGLYFLKKWRFVKSTNLGFGIVGSIYCLKIVFGIGYALFFLKPNNGILADTWNFYTLSISETNSLIKNPIHFIKDIWENNYTNNNLFNGTQNIFNNLKTTIFTKILAILNVFTIKNYYANLVILNFIFLVANLSLYKLFLKGYNGNKWLLIGSVFLIPNFIFWQSGLHKDGLIFSLICVILYAVNKLLTKGLKLNLFLGLMISLIVIFLIKNYILFLLLLSIAMYLVLLKTKWHKGLIISLFFVFGIAFFYLLGGFEILAAKRAEFLQLPSNTLVKAPLLTANPKSAFTFLPSALSMSLFQPKFWQANNSFALGAGLHQFAVLLIIGLLIYLPKKNKKNTPFILCCISFGCLVWLLNGYIIPFSGAIVRYNSLSLPFIIGGLVSWASPQFIVYKWGKR